MPSKDRWTHSISAVNFDMRRSAACVDSILEEARWVVDRRIKAVLCDRATSTDAPVLSGLRKLATVCHCRSLRFTQLCGLACGRMEVMTMFVAELRWPGTRLAAPDGDGVETLLHIMESHLVDANVALVMFRQSHRQPPPSEPLWIRTQAERAAVRSQLEDELPIDLTPSERWDAESRLSEEAERIVYRRHWAAGEPPSVFEMRVPSLHARSFVFALDGIVKAMGSLKKISQASNADAGLQLLRGAVPSLVAVRDTTHHLEHRGRGLDRDGNPLQLRAVDVEGFAAPGGAVATNILLGDRYGCTVGDGSYGEVSINEQSLSAARDAIQLAIDGYSWSGHARWSP